MENFVLFDAKLLRFELLDKPMAAVPAVSPFVGCFDQPLPLLPELIDAVSAKTDVVASTADRLLRVGGCLSRTAR
jgi:hypothetical protein